MSLSFATEKQVAVAAVRRACWLTSSVFNKLVKNETLTKGDKSPVTGISLSTHDIANSNIFAVGDYSAQAVISIILQHAFPDDPIVGEEDAAELRAESGEGMRNRIVELANEALTGELGLGDNADWGIGPGQEKTPAALLDAIDRGNHPGGDSGRKFLFPPVVQYVDLNIAGSFLGMWTIDPIDGTKGFLRGEQYAVCLSLIVDAQVKVGVIGCPNLPIDPENPDSGRGCIFVAVKGQGAEQVSFVHALRIHDRTITSATDKYQRRKPYSSVDPLYLGGKP